MHNFIDYSYGVAVVVAAAAAGTHRLGDSKTR